MFQRVIQKSSLVAAILSTTWIVGCDQSANSNQSDAAPSTTTVAQRSTPPQTPPSAPGAQPQQKPATPPPARHDHSRGAPPQTPVLGQPPIEFDPPMLDLGVVRPNQRVTGTIYIQNISDKWLKILQTKADCTCTSVDLSNTMLAPGERIPMRADYNSSAAMGEKRSAVRVLVEGYDMAEVSIVAFVTMPVKAEPPFITAVRDAQGQTPVSGEYVVESLNKQPFRVLAVNGKPAEYVDYDPASAEVRNKYTLKWDFSSYNPQTCTDTQGNKIPGWIIVETDHPDCPVFDLEVRHECNRRPRRQPTDSWYIPEKRVLIGKMKDGQAEEIEVLVKWLNKTRTTDPVATVISEMPSMKAELVGTTPEPDGMYCKIKITTTPGHRGLVYGNIRLHSKNQSAPVVIVASVTD